MAEIREEEARCGAETLGIPRSNVHFLRVAGNKTDRTVIGSIHRVLEHAFGTYKVPLPFVFTHTAHDRHADHKKCESIASSVFRVPILKFAVASSAEAYFQPDICIDISDYFDLKVEAFEQHRSQAQLKAGPRPIVEVLRDFDGRNRRETGFTFSECFEMSSLAVCREFDPVLEICDSPLYRQRLAAKLSTGDSSQALRIKSRVLLAPNASCAAMLQSGRLPFSFGYVAIDGCAEVFATPTDESRYGGFRKDQVKCMVTDVTWDPDVQSSDPIVTRSRLQAALEKWRKQTSYPRALRTLLAAPAEPVTDRQGVELLFGCSDYFTVRSITELARNASFDEGIGILFPAHDWWADTHSSFGVDVPPYHASVQGIILNRDPETGTFGLVLTAYNFRANPIAGGIGVSMAEQMTAHRPLGKPPWWQKDERLPPPEEGDVHVFDTLERGLLEEFSLRRSDYQPPLLLSACLEADMFFVTFLFVVRTDLRPEELFERWRCAPDRQESQILALFPIGRGRGDFPPASAVSAIVDLLGHSEFDPGPFLLPRAVAPGTVAPQSWHPSSRMRLYAAAKHWWTDTIDEFVTLAS